MWTTTTTTTESITSPLVQERGVNTEMLGRGPGNKARHCSIVTYMYMYLAVFSHEYIEDHFIESSTELGLLVGDVGKDHL